MTNGEYIQQMNSGELTDFLLSMFLQEIDFSKRFCKSCHECDCDECMLWWLNEDTKQPQGLEYQGEVEGPTIWINAERESPKEEGEYLTVCRHKNNGHKWIAISYYEPPCKWEIWRETDVTHWMKLPELPEESEQEGKTK